MVQPIKDTDARDIFGVDYESAVHSSWSWGLSFITVTIAVSVRLATVVIAGGARRGAHVHPPQGLVQT